MGLLDLDRLPEFLLALEQPVVGLEKFADGALGKLDPLTQFVLDLLLVPLR